MTQAGAAAPENHSFTQWLRDRAAEAGRAGKASKGERTRERIVAAAADALAGEGFHSLRMTDIAARAEVSPAALYQYFKNKTEITIEVMTEFLRRTEELLLSRPLTGDPYSEIYQATLGFVLLYRENSGLMRQLRGLSEELPEIGQLTTETYAKWRGRLGRNLTAWSCADKKRERMMKLTAHALTVMSSEFLYDIYIRKDPTLADLADSPEEIAAFFSAHWLRAARGEDTAR